MIYARPFDYTEGDPLRVTAILDTFVNQPAFLTYPTPPDEARVLGAHILTNPQNLVYEAWREQESVGIILLTRIVPRVDALFHFMFTDRNLVTKRKLLNNFLGFCFNDLGFHRISMEIPDGGRLEKFARRVLGFKLEGEDRVRSEGRTDKSVEWLARQGSRIESARFTGTEWKDIIRLRLLACEWVDGDKGGRPCQSEPSQAQPHQS